METVGFVLMRVLWRGKRYSFKLIYITGDMFLVAHIHAHRHTHTYTHQCTDPIATVRVWATTNTRPHWPDRLNNKQLSHNSPVCVCVCICEYVFVCVRIYACLLAQLPLSLCVSDCVVVKSYTWWIRAEDGVHWWERKRIVHLVVLTFLLIKNVLRPLWGWCNDSSSRWCELRILILEWSQCSLYHTGYISTFHDWKQLSQLCWKVTKSNC